MNYVLTIYCFR